MMYMYEVKNSRVGLKENSLMFVGVHGPGKFVALTKI